MVASQDAQATEGVALLAQKEKDHKGMGKDERLRLEMQEAFGIFVEVRGGRAEWRERGVRVLLGPGLWGGFVAARELAWASGAGARVEAVGAAGVVGRRDALDHAFVEPVVAGEDEPAAAVALFVHAAVAEAPGLAAGVGDVGLVSRSGNPLRGGGPALLPGARGGRGRDRDARGERCGDARHGLLRYDLTSSNVSLVRLSRA